MCMIHNCCSMPSEKKKAHKHLAIHTFDRLACAAFARVTVVISSLYSVALVVAAVGPSICPAIVAAVRVTFAAALGTSAVFVAAFAGDRPCGCRLERRCISEA